MNSNLDILRPEWTQEIAFRGFARLIEAGQIQFESKYRCSPCCVAHLTSATVPMADGCDVYVGWYNWDENPEMAVARRLAWLSSDEYARICKIPPLSDQAIAPIMKAATE